MTCFITKYALTQGILEVEGTELPARRRRHPEIEFKLPGFWEQYCKMPDWHRDKPAAIARAEQMRLSAIASLKKKLAKLELLTFTE